MMNIRDFRLLNTQYLIDAKYNGVRRRLALDLGIQATAVTRWFKGGREIGDEAAENIEKVTKKRPGWLDVPHPALWDLNNEELTELNALMLDVDPEDLPKKYPEFAGTHDKPVLYLVSDTQAEYSAKPNAELIADHIIARAEIASKNSTSALLNDFEALPKDKQKQLLDFLDFLKTKP